MSRQPTISRYFPKLKIKNLEEEVDNVKQNVLSSSPVIQPTLVSCASCGGSGEVEVILRSQKPKPSVISQAANQNDKCNLKTSPPPQQHNPLSTFSSASSVMFRKAKYEDRYKPIMKKAIHDLDELLENLEISMLDAERSSSGSSCSASIDYAIPPNPNSSKQSISSSSCNSVHTYLIPPPTTPIPAVRMRNKPPAAPVVVPPAAIPSHSLHAHFSSSAPNLRTDDVTKTIILPPPTPHPSKTYKVKTEAEKCFCGQDVCKAKMGSTSSSGPSLVPKRRPTPRNSIISRNSLKKKKKKTVFSRFTSLFSGRRSSSGGGSGTGGGVEVESERSSLLNKKPKAAAAAYKLRRTQVRSKLVME